jgi:hypothetical protein
VTGGRRGWGAAAGLALLAAISPAVHPLLLMTVPLALLVLAAPPPRPALIAFAVALAGLLLIGGAGGTLWYAERGWALVVGAWFLVAAFVWPAGSFVHRALAALAAATVSAIAIFAFAPTVWAELDWAIADRVRSGATRFAALGASPAAGLRELSALLYRWAELNAWLYPALVGLASLGGLGVAWWAYRRVGFRDPAPLGRMRDFRFRSELAWLVVVGALLVVLTRAGWWWPGWGASEETALRTGANLLAFMGALYLFRGIAVLATLAGGLSLGGAVVMVVAVLFLYPLVLATALFVGLTDTWVDLRARWQAGRDR